MCICSILLLLFITVLLPTGPLPLKVCVFVLLVEIFSPYLEVTVSSLCTEIRCASSDSATVTWSFASKSVLKSLFHLLFFPFSNNVLYICVCVCVC